MKSALSGRLAFLSALLGITLLTAAGARAQHCATMDNYFDHARENPALPAAADLFNKKMTRGARGANAEDTARRVIPVVFHIIHVYGNENISRAAILNQMKTLNQTYGGTNPELKNVRDIFKDRIATLNLEFRLATKDPNGNCTDGVTRTYSSLTLNAYDNVKSLIQWDPTKYLNVWLVQNIENRGGQGTILGFAQFPFDNNNKTDGIVCRADQMTLGNHTLTHEVGHYLGLFHTFETAFGSDCSNSNCTNAGDFICDTPPESGVNFSCVLTTNSCKGDNPDLPDMLENFMSYSSCSKMFTLGQKDRIISTLLNVAKRKNLWQQSNLEATGTDDNAPAVLTCRPKADFISSTPQTCEGTLVSFTDKSWNGVPTQWKWSFEDGQPATSTSQNPTVKFTKPGKKKVTLEVTNAGGTGTLTRNEVINIMPDESNIKAPYAENFEATTIKGISGNRDNNSLGWDVNTQAAYSGTHSYWLNTPNGIPAFRYTFDLPPVDLTTLKPEQANLSYKVAYRQASTGTIDGLRVMYSANCGNTWNLLYYRAGKVLANGNDPMSAPFFPASANDWKSESLSLASLLNQKSVSIRFDFYCQQGNNIFIDDVNIGDNGTGIFTGAPAALPLEVFPNPATEYVTLQWGNMLPAGTSAQFVVSDATGRLLHSERVDMYSSAKFATSNLGIRAAGVYFLTLTTPSGDMYRSRLVIK